MLQYIFDENLIKIALENMREGEQEKYTNCENEGNISPLLFRVH